MATNAKLMKSMDTKVEMVTTASTTGFVLTNMLAVLRNIAPVLIYVGRGASSGIRNAIRKGIEKRSIRRILSRYIPSESETTFAILSLF
jgi:hypothetical protein